MFLSTEAAHLIEAALSREISIIITAETLFHAAVPIKELGSEHLGTQNASFSNEGIRGIRVIAQYHKRCIFFGFGDLRGQPVDPVDFSVREESVVFSFKLID